MSFVFLFLISTLSTALFWGNFPNFFFQDDFFNMALAQGQSLVSAFNIFQKPILDFNFYRPLTTQLYWLLGQNLFGWNQVGYHLISFGFFLINIFLVFYLTKLLTSNRKIWYLTTFFYAISASHFYRLFFLSQFQEIALATFSFLTLILFIKKKYFCLLTFILALMCKETAVVLPVVLLFYNRKFSKILFYLTAILIVYLFARIFFFGFASGGAYVYNFNPKSVLNNYFWYTLWGLNIPESFVNLRLFNPEVFTAFGIWGGPIVTVFCLFILTILLGFNRKFTINKELLFGVLIFLVFLLPVAFFPFHKFAYSLTVPAFGLSLVLAHVVSQQSAKFMWSVILFYFILSFFTTQYNLTHHWASTKARIANQAFNYFKVNYPLLSDKQNVYFQNDDRIFCSNNNPSKNLSSEVAYGIGGTYGLRLLYNKPDLEVWFWDWDKYQHLDGNSVIINSYEIIRDPDSL